jgi:hypothetical protein
VGGERGLAHAAFLVEQRDDHGRPSVLESPAVALRFARGGCPPARFYYQLEYLS